MAIHAALAKRPADRPASATAFADLLTEKVRSNPEPGTSTTSASAGPSAAPTNAGAVPRAERPVDGDTIPVSSDWHFSHLGRRYFDEYFARCQRLHFGPLRYVYTGKLGEPYANKAHGRQVSPNFMAEDVNG